ncbi:MAG TPA: bifunctional aldolase/short-chain dehydrogenase [Acidobacteriota bacterium]|nr:bifunctional aldolase/short-chain dehydrogenase [Acidobacteriota bacterium]
MKNRWSDEKAARFIEDYGGKFGADLAIGLYTASLIGSERRLVLHGGGNSSVKTVHTNLLGEIIPAIFVKASGFDMAEIEPNGYIGLDLEHLKKLQGLSGLTDEEMVNEFRTHFLKASSATPSIETLVHVFVQHKFVQHTHPDAILTLSNQYDGETVLRKALGDDIEILGYSPPGFKLAKAVSAVLNNNPSAKAVILMHHGLLTWGDIAREAYERTIEIATSAENFIEKNARNPLVSVISTPQSLAESRFKAAAPIIRGLLAKADDNPDDPWKRVVLRPLIKKNILDFVDSDRGRAIALTPPLTADHLIRTKPYYLWVDDPQFDNPDEFRAQLSRCINSYTTAYTAYIEKYSETMPPGINNIDILPRVLLIPGMGMICSGMDASDAGIVMDIAAHTIEVKTHIAAMGEYCGMKENDIFEMEFRALQRAKLQGKKALPLSGKVALVTGAAGAIGAGIIEALLEQGCHVAITDLPGERLNAFVEEMRRLFGDRVMGTALDITDPESVSHGFENILGEWGGIDLIVLNAGIAHVSSLSDLTLESFRKAEKINVEGVLVMLKESARIFGLQKTGGDIVLISTKNVFAPGAAFGAYSATKTAGHQLARIASQEFASMDVRVNMVSPDAVFSHGSRKSGLWLEIGPERMNKRGLSPEGLEEYYRNRNLLKARVTARHVGNAVLFFATRKTPTTGATIPVDGGLPDATPR